jgi:hypothetical protein
LKTYRQGAKSAKEDAKEFFGGSFGPGGEMPQMPHQGGSNNIQQTRQLVSKDWVNADLT